MNGEGRLVVVGASWGGLEAIGELLAPLPERFEAAIAVVQHRGVGSSDGTMGRYLASRCSLQVTEVEDKTPIEPRQVYVGPPDYHLLVDQGVLGLSLEAPVAFSRPSIDVLFETAADSYGAELIAVVLTGANGDGSRGAVAVKRAGGTVLVQDPDQAERRQMPDATIATDCADAVLRLDDLSDRLIQLVAGP